MQEQQPHFENVDEVDHAYAFSLEVIGSELEKVIQAGGEEVCQELMEEFESLKMAIGTVYSRASAGHVQAAEQNFVPLKKRSEELLNKIIKLRQILTHGSNKKTSSTINHPTAH
jgi:hypothetical protein